VALSERPHKIVRTDRKRQPQGHQVRITSDPDVPVPIYTSDALDTKGFTLQNVFASIQIKEDNFPNAVLNLFITLEGSYSSAWCEQNRSGVLPYSGPGSYNFGLVASDDSLATMIRFRILARPSSDPGAQRVLRVFIDAMLAAGYQF
jgi:hypothetical protein